MKGAVRELISQTTQSEFVDGARVSSVARSLRVCYSSRQLCMEVPIVPIVIDESTFLSLILQ